MSFIGSDIKNNKLPGAVLGAGVAYSWVGEDLLTLAVGAAAGWFVYPSIQNAVIGAMPSSSYNMLVAPAALGALIGYGYDLPSYTNAAAGAAGAAALEFVINKY